MYTNIVQHYNCQSQDNFSTLNITLSIILPMYMSAPLIEVLLKAILVSLSKTTQRFFHHEIY